MLSRSGRGRAGRCLEARACATGSGIAASLGGRGRQEGIKPLQLLAHGGNASEGAWASRAPAPAKQTRLQLSPAVAAAHAELVPTDDDEKASRRKAGRRPAAPRKRPLSDGRCLAPKTNHWQQRLLAASGFADSPRCRAASPPQRECSTELQRRRVTLAAKAGCAAADCREGGRLALMACRSLRCRRSLPDAWARCSRALPAPREPVRAAAAEQSRGSTTSVRIRTRGSTLVPARRQQWPLQRLPLQRLQRCRARRSRAPTLKFPSCASARGSSVTPAVSFSAARLVLPPDHAQLAKSAAHVCVGAEVPARSGHRRVAARPADARDRS